MSYIQARREPQRGPGKYYRRAPVTPLPHSVCLEIENPKVSRGRKHGERCPLTIQLGVRGSVISSPSGAPAENGFYAYFTSEKKPPGTPFSVFVSDCGAPKRRGARENSPSPLDGPAYITTIKKQDSNVFKQESSAKLTNQRVSYAFTSSPFSFHARHILPTSKFQLSYSCILLIFYRHQRTACVRTVSVKL